MSRCFVVPVKHRLSAKAPVSIGRVDIRSATVGQLPPFEICLIGRSLASCSRMSEGGGRRPRAPVGRPAPLPLPASEDPLQTAVAFARCRRGIRAERWRTSAPTLACSPPMVRRSPATMRSPRCSTSWRCRASVWISARAAPWSPATWLYVNRADASPRRYRAWPAMSVGPGRRWCAAGTTAMPSARR